MNDQVRLYFRIALAALILLGAVLVLAPFLAAILFAAILCLTTWPLMSWTERRLGGRTTLAAASMTLFLVAAVLLPMSYFSLALADGVTLVLDQVKAWFDAGDRSPPAWLARLPLAGPYLESYWNQVLGNQEELLRLGQLLFEPARKLVLSTVALIGEGLLELVLVVFIAFFVYRDGRAIAARLSSLAAKIGGELGSTMLTLARSTIAGVMIGIVGTAAAQSLVALVGFLIAGVPAPLLLAGATFFLSMIPLGPPLIWGGAAWWLYQQGQTGWAIFMVVYGAAVISSIDNFVKPLLISRTASLPILLVALGVFGGVLAFGFIGIFLGPVMLALALTLVDSWSAAAASERKIP